MTGLPDIVRGRVSGDGRLLEADALLAMLNAQCGGRLGEPLAIPALTPLVRLSQRLGILISRAITVADDGHDLSLWVRAFAEEDGVRLALSGWTRSPAWVPPADPERRDDDFAASDAEWRWSVDAALRLTFVGRVASERHGVDRGALLGAPLTRLFVLEEGEGAAMPILQAAASRASFAGQRVRVRSDDAIATIDGRVRTDPAGVFAGFDGNVRTDPPRSAGRPTLASTVVDQLGQALRPPLGRIIARADSIYAQDNGPLAPDYADYAADIATAGRHLLALVDDLADVSAIEQADFTLREEVIDIADVARRAAGLLSVRANDGSVTIVRPEIDEHMRARGDFRRALQILINLLGNAVRYSPRGATVWIRLQDEGGRVVVIVADQGRGIAAADQARIFDKFERVDPDEPGGNGLGLYIARRLARAMGGDLTVDSAPGQGARFLLVLPAA